MSAGAAPTIAPAWERRELRQTRVGAPFNTRAAIAEWIAGLSIREWFDHGLGLPIPVDVESNLNRASAVEVPHARSSQPKARADEICLRPLLSDEGELAPGRFAGVRFEGLLQNSKYGIGLA
jgi:hypothetical protein